MWKPRKNNSISSRALCGFAFLLSLSLGFSARGDDQDNAKTLCGQKPAQESEAKNLAKLKSLEKDMPPIQDQSQAEWCYAFETTDLINYFIHQSRLKVDPKAKYTEASQISPIDAVYLEKKYVNLSKTPPVTDEAKVNMTEGGNGLDMLIGVNDAQVVRSRKQIKFISDNSTDPETTKVVDEIIARYEKKQESIHDNIESEACSKEEASEVNSFKVFNQWLAKEDAKLKNKDPHVIAHYVDIVRKKGAPDLSIPEFTPRQLSTSDPLEYLNSIRQNLDQKVPVGTSLCVLGMIPDGRPGCGDHVMTIVGAEYIGGKCTVRLRNTWGKGWKDSGYVNVPLTELMKAASQKNKGKYELTWIETPKMEKPKSFDYVDSWVSSEDHVKLAGSFHGDHSLVDGKRTYPDGSSETLQNGFLTSSDRAVFDPKLGSHFTGTYTPDPKNDFSSIKDGVLTNADGSSEEYQNGVIVRTHNMIWDKKVGTRFTGTVTSNSKREIFMKDGELAFPDGSSDVYQNGVRVRMNNTVWDDKTGTRYSGTLRDNSAQDGTITGKDGSFSIIKNGHTTEEKNFLRENGERRTGTFGTWGFDGFVIDAKGQRRNYKHGFFVGPLW